MAQELITVETRVTHLTAASPLTVFTPAVGEKVHVLFVLIHKLIEDRTFDITNGTTTIAKIRNGKDDTGGGILLHERNTATLSQDGIFLYNGIVFVRDADGSGNQIGDRKAQSVSESQFKAGQIKIPVAPNSAGAGVITDTDPLTFVFNGDIITSVWVIRET